MSPDVLRLDAEAEAERISRHIGHAVRDVLHRRGVVVGLSGGIDSSVSAALAVRALGTDRVLGLFMPETESSPESLELGRLVAARLGIHAVEEDVTNVLDATGCYRRRDEAIRRVIPEYHQGYRSKLVRQGPVDGQPYSLFMIVVQSPDGAERRQRLTADTYREIVAATSFKQRVRKMVEYYHADRLQYAVVGTANLLEHDQGFFVKNGDGAADVKPISHLYKTQIYQLAEYFELPEAVRRRDPTADTYSLPQGQDEFFFALPYRHFDLCLYGRTQGVPAGEVADLTGLSLDVVKAAYSDIDRKRTATSYLHAPALSVAPGPH